MQHNIFALSSILSGLYLYGVGADLQINITRNKWYSTSKNYKLRMFRTVVHIVRLMSCAKDIFTPSCDLC
jgi:hypothetical protein